MILQLDCPVQTYAWGKMGSASKVAQLASGGTSGFVVDEKKPYAELWMGTHPNAPATVRGTDKTTLKVKLDERSLSPEVFRCFNGDLPFLFKVLSVGQALSIQAHPSKKLAEWLHSSRPDLYRDANHKPEMCVALTSFEALCGFRNDKEISQMLRAFPELRTVVGMVDNVADSEATPLKPLFHRLMTASEASLVRPQLAILVARLEAVRPASGYQLGSVEELVLRLNSQYPGDVGCFCALLLNYVRLEPGQAMFLAANEPHAYLSGDCIECMATSDNVVRAGLTPKVKDVDTLVNMLTYRAFSPADITFKGSPWVREDGTAITSTTLYDTPIPEFAVLRTILPANKSEHFDGMHGPSLLLVTEGRGAVREDGSSSQINVTSGNVLFIGAREAVTLQAVNDSGLTVFRAFTTDKRCARLSQ